MHKFHGEKMQILKIIFLIILINNGYVTYSASGAVEGMDEKGRVAHSIVVQKGFCKELWESLGPSYNRIIEHDFFKQLQAGTLDKELFKFYEDQGFLYVQKRAATLKVVVDKLAALHTENKEGKITYADVEYLKAVSDKTENKIKGKLVTYSAAPGTQPYLDFMERREERSLEEELGGLLLLPWVYQVLGEHLSIDLKYDHPYKSFIERYNDPERRQSVQTFIEIVNRIAEMSPGRQAGMKDIFIQSATLELSFLTGIMNKNTHKND